MSQNNRAIEGHRIDQVGQEGPQFVPDQHAADVEVQVRHEPSPAEFVSGGLELLSKYAGVVLMEICLDETHYGSPMLRLGDSQALAEDCEDQQLHPQHEEWGHGPRYFV